jgi:hypothetical protein
MSWDKAGTTLSGKFGGIEQYYVPGYGYREQGHIATEPCGACGRGEDVTFTLPLDLYDKLGEIKTGTPIRITFVKHQGSRKIFSVEAQS